jgi:DNA processing protein
MLDLKKLLLSIACYERSKFFKAWNSLSRAEPEASWSEKLERILVATDFETRSFQFPKGMSFVSLVDLEYPAVFRELSQPPLGLFVWGDWNPDTRLVAVVGSRKPTPYSLRMTRTCVVEAVSKGFGIVSGGALGIDAEAHRAAVDSEGQTLVILGGGFSKLYPKSHFALYEKIRSGFGALVSEYPPWAESRAYQFPERNRLIAALGEKLLLIQAHDKSGSMITARAALDLGRDVDVLRPPLGDENFSGSLKLIEAGARVISSAKDWTHSKYRTSEISDLNRAPGSKDSELARV